MKFACPKCNTRYSIADDKVPPGKVLKFPCKTCGNVVRLRRKEGDQNQAQILEGSSITMMQGASGEPVENTRIASVAEINKLRNASTEATRIGMPAPTVTSAAEDAGETTRIVSVEQINILRAAAAEDIAAPEPQLADERTTVAPMATEPSEWFVLIAGKQRGPMSASQVDGMLAKNEIDRRTFVWKSGMGNWERLGNVERFGVTAEPEKPVPQPAPRAPQPVAKAHTKSETFNLADEIGEETASGIFNAVTRQQQGPDRAAAEMRANAEMIEEVTAEPIIEEEDEPRTFYKAETMVVSDPRLVAQLQATDPQNARQIEAVANAFQAGPSERDSAAPSFASSNRTTDTFIGRDIDVDPLAGLDDPRSLQAFDDVSQQIALPNEHSGMGSMQDDPAYLDAPPGESTRVYMATAGIYKKRRNNKIAAVIATVAVMLIAGFIVMDMQGLIVLPGMGAVYDATGVEDPNIDRALERTENKLAAEDLEPKKRAQLESLRRKLLDKSNTEVEPKSKRDTPKQVVSANESPKEDAKEGVPEEKAGVEQHDMAEQLFADTRKTDVNLKLATPETIQTPNLPDGLTQEAIYKVVNDNNTSMKLCYAEAARKGEKLAGKMEVQLTIDATGEVSGAEINTPQFKNGAMGQCTVRRVKTWKFPRFNGQPVTVVFPYVLQSAF